MKQLIAYKLNICNVDCDSILVLIKRVSLQGVIPGEKTALETDQRLQVENDRSCAVGHFRGDKRGDFQCRASSDHSPLHSSFLRSSLASFSRLTLHPSLKTPAAFGGEREGGKGGGGGRG